MMRPTRRICRRPPELQAANARAFSKGTPSSRRAFARDTWRKLKNSDSARNVTLQNEGRRMKQNDTLISIFNPNLKKEHTVIQKNTLYPVYSIGYTSGIFQTCFSWSRGAGWGFRHPKAQKEKGNGEFCVGKKKGFEWIKSFDPFLSNKIPGFSSLAAMGIPGSQPLQIRILMLPPPGSDPEISHVESDPRISCVQLFCLCFWMLFAAEQFNLKLIHSYSFLDISESRGVRRTLTSQIFMIFGEFCRHCSCLQQCWGPVQRSHAFCPCGRM